MLKQQCMRGNFYITLQLTLPYPSTKAHTHSHSWTSCCTHTNISLDRTLNRDSAGGMEEEEVLTSCCCRDTKRTGGFISAHARMRFHLESTEQSVGDSSSHFREDNFEVSAGHRQRNLQSFQPLRKDFTLLLMKKV